MFMLKKFLLLASCLTLSLASVAAIASECPDYDRVTTQLGKKFHEQMVFSGFTDSKDKQAAAAIYEFWANPEKGNWSLIAHKLLQFQIDGKTKTKDCAFIVNSGKQFQLTKIDPEVTAVDVNNQAETATPTNPSCIPHDFYAQTLKNRYQEVPVVQALAKDDAMVEIYASADSWTITSTKVQSSRNTMTGTVLRDEKTGQEIHQLCSRPAFSGKSWGTFQFVEKHI